MGYGIGGKLALPFGEVQLEASIAANFPDIWTINPTASETITAKFSSVDEGALTFGKEFEKI